MNISLKMPNSQLSEAKADTQSLVNFAGKDLAFRFLAVKSRLKVPENDLYYWIKNKTVDELEQAVAKAESTKSKSKERKELSKGAELIAENDYWKVYKINTFEAAQKYGRDTNWCITGANGTGDKHWKSYSDLGISFYFYITKGEYDPRGTNSKYALAISSDGYYEVHDQQNNEIYKDDIPNAPSLNIQGISFGYNEGLLARKQNISTALKEWKVNSKSMGSSAKSTAQSTKNQTTDVVYIWDMYIDPLDKGNWCSAEKYQGVWDGYVYKTKESAYNGGLSHLHELDDTGELIGLLEDYTIDVVAIPRIEVSDYTLDFSGI